MKGAKAASLVFPAKADDDVDSLDGAVDEEDEDSDAEPSDRVGTLLGNAYDALDDGDREGFVASLKAAIRAGK